jgi:hypothetical protein
MVRKGFGWVYDPQSGGTKISENNKWIFRQQAEKFAKDRPWSSEYELIVRFKSQFCYLDALKKGENRAFPIGRLRYFRDNVWSLAFFTYSNETYQPCVFLNGDWEGTLEEGIAVCEAHIGD